jgi:hypothetical protein
MKYSSIGILSNVYQYLNIGYWTLINSRQPMRSSSNSNGFRVHPFSSSVYGGKIRPLTVELFGCLRI